MKDGLVRWPSEIHIEKKGGNKIKNGEMTLKINVYKVNYSMSDIKHTGASKTNGEVAHF